MARVKHDLLSPSTTKEDSRNVSRGGSGGEGGSMRRNVSFNQEIYYYSPIPEAPFSVLRRQKYQAVIAILLIIYDCMRSSHPTFDRPIVEGKRLSFSAS